MRRTAFCFQYYFTATQVANGSLTLLNKLYAKLTLCFNLIALAYSKRSTDDVENSLWLSNVQKRT